MPQCCGCQYGETSMSVGGSERRNATRPTRRNGRNIEFSADLTRIVPCDAVAIGGKLLQNNGIELCAPDRCCDSGGSPSAPSLSAGIARHGLQLWLCWIFWTRVHAARTDLPLLQVDRPPPDRFDKRSLHHAAELPTPPPFAGGARQPHATVKPLALLEDRNITRQTTQGGARCPIGLLAGKLGDLQALGLAPVRAL